MKKDIHPDYHPVVFRDVSGEFAFLTRSTATPSKTIVWEDGNTYPVVDIEISSATHPFYTGQSRVVDTAGRVEKFRQRYGDRRTQGAAQKAAPEPSAPEPSAPEPPAAEAPTDDDTP